MPKNRTEPVILQMLSNDKLQSFTCTELAETYFQRRDCRSPNFSAARQVVTRWIKRAVDAELLVKTGSLRGKATVYTLATQRHLDNHLEAQHEIQAGVGEDDGFTDQLKKRLSQYKIDLLAAIGEVEEYEALHPGSPERQKQIQRLYNRARDNYSKTLGRVRAIEALISNNSTACNL